MPEINNATIDEVIEIVEKSLEGSGLITARNLRHGQVYTMNTRYEGIEGDYFCVISNNAPNLRPGMGTPDVRCEAVERKGDGWVPRTDVPIFSVYHLELVRIQKC